LKNRNRNLLLGLFVLIVIAGGFVYFTRIADFPAAQATLVVRSGTALIVRPAGEPESIEAGKQALINNKDAITMNGQGSLAFAGAQADLAPGTEIEIAHYGALGDEAQVELLMKSGQVWQRLKSYQDWRSQYRLRFPGGTVSTRAGGVMVNITADQAVQVGAQSGEATVNAQDRSVTLASGQGTEIAPGQPPAEMTSWSPVRVLTYRADSSPVVLPASLTNVKTGDTYMLQSQETYVVPAGTYSLNVEALESYQVSELALSPDTLNEAAVTFSEVVFITTDVNGNPVPYTGLNVQGNSSVRAVPDSAVLVSPGKWTVFAAREEKPSAIQPVDVELLPGQRKVVALRNDLFGGGSVQVHVVAMDGSTMPPVNVFVYAVGNENSQPLLTFKSDTTPQALPNGKYVLSVRTTLAQRFEVEIKENQNVSRDVRLGALNVTYTDVSGHINPRSVLLYIASTPDIRRLGVAIEQMRRTPYGMALNCCTQVFLPAGLYNVSISDSAGIGQQNVLVEGGKVTNVELKAQAGK
jgi:hypothetical protein